MPWETPYSKLITLCKRCHLHVYHESKRKKKGDQNWVFDYPFLSPALI